MPWFALVIAGCMEIFGVIHLKRLTMGKWSSLFYLILIFGTSFALLSYAFGYIPMGTAYAIWTGIGTVGAAAVGMFLYGEPKEWKRLTCIAVILTAAVGLKLIS